jgi:guanylate cyclase
MAVWWKLEFDDAALEREFRSEMAARHRRATGWVAAAVTVLQLLQVPFDLLAPNWQSLTMRLSSLAILVPCAAAIATLSLPRFERLATALTSAMTLAFVGFFASTFHSRAQLALGTDMAGMAVCTTLIGGGIGILSLVSTRAIALLSLTAVVSCGVAVSVTVRDFAQVFSFWTLLIAGAVVGTFSAHSLQASRRREFAQARELDHERARSEALLHNMLPVEIADQLKRRTGLIAERFDAATVLFADIVGFTVLADRLPAERIVAMLDDVFSDFDEIAARRGLEKIKTIGDAYMVVGGVPRHREDHVEAVVAMAFEMQAAVARRSSPDAPLHLRIGIHTGPVVAGVIGKTKFVYDLWGDTVNTASRMESHGVPGAIHVTTEVRDRLPERFAAESRGKIAIKGKGELATFLLDVR